MTHTLRVFAELMTITLDVEEEETWQPMRILQSNCGCQGRRNAVTNARPTKIIQMGKNQHIMLLNKA